MAIVYRFNRTKVGTVELDATLREEHRAENQVTDHPVEKGAAVSDHNRTLPEGLTLEGIVSNTPISVADRDAAGPSPRGAPGRAELAYANLLRLRAAGEMITVVTRSAVYSNMAITSLDHSRTPQTGDTLRITIGLKRIRVVASQWVQVETEVPKAKPPVNQGKQVTEPAKEAEVYSSWLYEKPGKSWGLLPLFAKVTGQPSGVP